MFELKNTRKLNEIDSTGYFYQCSEGTKVVYIKNKNLNNVFSISLKTPPLNNKGIPHILEHCLLTGSNKYPIKDTFNALATKKMYTYLNAITFNEKTVYPFSSYNKEDFFDMMDVYLDAIYNSNLNSRKEIFWQEGFRYELKNLKLKPNGIVYNEMLGMYSDKAYIIKRKLYKYLFYNKNIKFDSAGDPKYIKTLKFEDLLEYYNEYYTMDNSLIYLYGDLDIEFYLNYIYSNYIHKYSKSISKNSFDLSKSENKYFSKLINETYYFSNSCLCVGLIMCKANNELEISCVEILINYLFKFNNSPLIKFLKSNFNTNIFYEFDKDISEPVLFFYLDNKNNIELNYLVNTLKDFWHLILKEGLDKELLLKSIKLYELNIKEKNYGYKPEGLIYNLEIVNNFILEDDLLKGFEKFKYLNFIKKNLDIFEKTIKDKFINNKNVVYLQIKNDKEIETNNYMPNEKDKKIIKKENLALQKFQKHDDKKTMNDLIKDSNINSCQLLENYNSKIETINVFNHNFKYINIAIKDINYMNFYFNINNLEEKYLPYLGMFIILVKEINNKMDEKYNYILESAQFDVNYYKKDLFFEIKFKVLKNDTNFIFEVFNNILLAFNFNSTKEIYEILNNFKNKITTNSFYYSKKIVKNISEIYFFNSALKKDKIFGFNFIKWLEDFLINYNEHKTNLKNNIIKLKESIFTQNNLTVYLISNIQNQECILNVAKKIYNLFPKKNYKNENYIFIREKNSIFINKQQKINDISVCSSFEKSGLTYSGKLLVVEKIINDYIYNNIRLKLGIYESGVEIKKDGNIVFYSYQNTNYKDTVDTFLNCYKYLEIFDFDLNKYKINAINDNFNFRHEYNYALALIENDILNLDKDFMLKEYDDILKFNINDIKIISHFFKLNLQDNNIIIL